MAIGANQLRWIILWGLCEAFEVSEGVTMSFCGNLWVHIRSSWSVALVTMCTNDVIQITIPVTSPNCSDTIYVTLIKNEFVIFNIAVYARFVGITESGRFFKKNSNHRSTKFIGAGRSNPLIRSEQCTGSLWYFGSATNEIISDLLYWRWTDAKTPLQYNESLG